jgi:hypothetical protein
VMFVPAVRCDVLVALQSQKPTPTERPVII